jgi:hypothetical protein
MCLTRTLYLVRTRWSLLQELQNLLLTWEIRCTRLAYVDMMDKLLISPFDSSPLMSVVSPWRCSVLCTRLFPQICGFVHHPPPQQTCSHPCSVRGPCGNATLLTCLSRSPRFLLWPPCHLVAIPVFLKELPGLFTELGACPPFHSVNYLFTKLGACPTFRPLLHSHLVIPPRACLYNWALCRTHKNRPTLAIVKCNRSIQCRRTQTPGQKTIGNLNVEDATVFVSNW